MLIEILFIGIGLYLAVGVGIFNLGMNGRRAQRMVSFIGVGGAKIFYIAAGILLIGTAIASLTGVISLG